MTMWKEGNTNHIKCDGCGEEDSLVRGNKSILKNIMRKYGWLIKENEVVYCSACRLEVDSDEGKGMS